MKSFTDISQSKTLAKILPIESADMRYSPLGDNMHPWVWTDTFIEKDAIPCWSLAALLSVIPKRIKVHNVLRIDISDDDFAIWYDEIGFGVNSDLPDITIEEPIDACVEMIIKLKEKGLM